LSTDSVAATPDTFYFDQSAEELIRHAKEHPPEPIIQGLLNVGETLVIHGTEESFKSVFVLQIAESVSTGGPLLRRWEVHSHYRVGVLDTEMHRAGLGERLGKMFAPGAPPDGLFFFGEDALARWRNLRFADKFAMLEEWISHSYIDVLIVDTANDFFRGHDNPSDERIVGEFFDRMRSLPLKARILVRHDRKKKEHDFGAHSNELIRGSARWKEDPEAILYLKRKDKRTHEVHSEVGKLRYGRKPESQALWFDARCFRLTPLPPVIAVLEAGGLSRQQVIAECEERFGINSRKADDLVGDEREFLTETHEGHRRILKIDPDHSKAAPWYSFLEYRAESQPMYIQSGPKIPKDAAVKDIPVAPPVPEGAE
jgi:AAA domain